MQRHEFPKAFTGQTIGLLGGSFDPAHEGHVHVSETALRAFGVDRVWWLVSPGNPLKHAGPAPLRDRIARAQEVVRNPKIEITDIEAKFGTHYTADTLQMLIHRFGRVRFLWLMGADNLAQFHLWKDWKWIAQQVPIGVVSRPNSGFAALNAPFARAFEDHRIPSAMSRTLAHHAAPAWCFVNAPLHFHSSTLLRAGGDWPNQ